jgi:hypothetical protein
VVEIPVIAVGGVTGIDDVLDYLAAGAVAVQAGTAIFADPTLPVRLVDGLAAECARRGLASYQPLIGTALPRRPGPASAKGVEMALANAGGFSRIASRQTGPEWPNSATRGTSAGQPACPAGDSHRAGLERRTMKPSIYLSRGTLPRPAALLAVLVLVVGCGGGAAGPVLAPIGERRDAAPCDGRAGTGAADRDGNPSTVVDAVRPELLVIKTGTLELQVEAVDAAVSAAEAKITALGGYVSGSEQVGEGEDVSATITYRIPADQWGAALKALRGLASRS